MSLKGLSTAEGGEFTKTVKFNVGGKTYEVSRSLLKGFPDTMLAKKANESSFFSPVFFDRDADRFAFVLDYMRDNGTVHLPETISKSAFLQELAFYGFADVDKTKILTDKHSAEICMSRFHQIRKSAKQHIAGLEENVKVLERDLCRRKEEIKMERVALKCFVESASIESPGQIFRVESGSLQNLDEDHYFIECCDKLALAVHGHHRGDVSVSLKNTKNEGKK